MFATWTHALVALFAQWPSNQNFKQNYELGKVKGNKMVDMQLSNKKLQKRAIKMIIHQINVSEAKATQLLECHQSVRRAIQAYQNG